MVYSGEGRGGRGEGGGGEGRGEGRDNVHVHAYRKIKQSYKEKREGGGGRGEGRGGGGRGEEVHGMSSHLAVSYVTVYRFVHSTVGIISKYVNNASYALLIRFVDISPIATPGS